MQDGAHVFAFFRSMGRSGGPIPPNASYAPVQTRVSAGSASPMERVAELIPQALESIKKMDEDEERERPPQVQAAYRE